MLPLAESRTPSDIKMLRGRDQLVQPFVATRALPLYRINVEASPSHCNALRFHWAIDELDAKGQRRTRAARECMPSTIGADPTCARLVFAPLTPAAQSRLELRIGLDRDAAARLRVPQYPLQPDRRQPSDAQAVGVRGFSFSDRDAIAAHGLGSSAVDTKVTGSMRRLCFSINILLWRQVTLCRSITYGVRPPVNRRLAKHPGAGLSPPFRIDDQLDATIPLLSFRRGVGNDRMVRPVTDHEKLLRTHPHPAGQLLVNGHRPGDRQLVVVAPLAAEDRIAVGVPLDADDLLGIVAAQLAGHLGNQVGRPAAEPRRAGLEQLAAGQLDADHVAVATNIDAGLRMTGSVCKKLLFGLIDTPF